MSAIWNLTRSLADVDAGTPPSHTIKCVRCAISYNVESYPQNRRGRKPERARCPECLCRFFSRNIGSITRVSVEPENTHTIPQEA